MSEKAWVCDLNGNHDIGRVTGVRGKLFNMEWDPVNPAEEVNTECSKAAFRKAWRGMSLRRDEMPECASVFSKKDYKKTKEIFSLRGYYVIKEPLADILSQFDFGTGGLFSLPLYEDDLITPIDEKLFLLNPPGQKDSLLPELNDAVEKLGVSPDTGEIFWKVARWLTEYQLTLSSAALDGPDLWLEKYLDNKIFLKDGLVRALREAGLAENWRIHETPCRIVESA